MSLSTSTALTVYQVPALKPSPSPQSLVVVDPAVKDLAIVMHSLNQTAELLVLDAAEDGIAQISAKLRACSTIETLVETLHIFAPSCPGVMKLGSTCLDAAALESHRSEIEAWRQVLSPRADIVLHGQNIAIGTEGMALVGRLSQLTGAVVMPSNLPRAASRRPVQHLGLPLAG